MCLATGDVAHALEQVGELLRLGMGELDELEAVGAGRIGGADGGGRGVVREGTHGKLLRGIAAFRKYRASGAQVACIQTPASAHIVHDLCMI